MENRLLIARIKEGDDQVIQKVYNTYRDEFIVWANKYHHCDFEEAKEVYQICMVQLYENIVNGKLTVLTSNLKTYLFGIGKNKIREIRSFNAKKITEIGGEDTTTEDRLLHESILDKVEEALNHLGDPCKKLLELFYYQKMSLVQITDLLDYKNTDTTKSLKYKCLGRLRRIYTGNA